MVFETGTDAYLQLLKDLLILRGMVLSLYDNIFIGIWKFLCVHAGICPEFQFPCNKAQVFNKLKQNEEWIWAEQKK